MPMKDLKKFFHPESIAIIGASANFSSISGKPVKILLQHNFPGDIYPVNPRYEEIGGLKCYPSVLDVPGQIDLAIVAVSASRLMSIVKDCIAKKVRNLLLFSSGFAEIGESGRKIQDEVAQLAKANNIRIIGPNSAGCLNVKDSIPMSFATTLESAERFQSGNVGFVSQSGALGFSVFGLAQERDLGFTYIINTGNEMDITTLDSMEFMLEDKDTTVIAGYMEGVPDGKQLIRVAKRAKALKKPLIILKSGTSALGKEAALSHTASLAGSEETFQVIAKQYGLIMVKDIDEMIDAMQIFSGGKVAKGNRLATISNSGAEGIKMADFSEQFNIQLKPLQGETKKKVEAIIPAYGSALNPIDVTAQALTEQHIIPDTVEALAKSDEVDVIVVQTTFGGELGVQICQQIVELDKKVDKPIVVAVTGTEQHCGKGRRVLRQNGVPAYVTTYDTMVAVKHLMDAGEFHDLPIVAEERLSEDPIQLVQDEYKTHIWTEEKVKEILAQLKVKVPKSIVIRSIDDIEKHTGDLQFPLVAKVLSDEILHKTDAGGVKLDIQNVEEAKRAFHAIIESGKKYKADAQIEGVLLEEMLQEQGVEMFIGIKNDSQFGSFIVCGLGGIFIEVLKDVSIRHIPIQKEDAYSMLEELQGYPMLLGTRGQEKLDIDALAEALVSISDFVQAQNGTLQEMDINPVVVLKEGDGIIALDGLMIWDEVKSTTLV